MAEQELWASVEDAAKHLGVAKDTVYRWIESKALPAHKIGRLWFFRGVVGDGTGRVLSQHLFAVRELGLGGEQTFLSAHPIRLHNLPPRAGQGSDALPPETSPPLSITEGLRSAFLRQHPGPALAAIEKEATRRMGRGKSKRLVPEMTILEAGLWTRHPDELWALELRLAEKQGAELRILAPDEPAAPSRPRTPRWSRAASASWRTSYPLQRSSRTTKLTQTATTTR